MTHFYAFNGLEIRTNFLDRKYVQAMILVENEKNLSSIYPFTFYLKLYNCDISFLASFIEP